MKKKEKKRAEINTKGFMMKFEAVFIQCFLVAAPSHANVKKDKE